MTDRQTDRAAHESHPLISRSHTLIYSTSRCGRGAGGVTRACTRTLIIHQDCRRESEERCYCLDQALAANTHHPSVSKRAPDKVFTADIGERRLLRNRLSNEHQHVASAILHNTSAELLMLLVPHKLPYAAY